jgi:hypothetical protein
LFVPCLTLLAFGCAGPAASPFRPGDTVRPEISFAPEAPWPAGAKVAVGVLVRVERPGGEGHYLHDNDVSLEQAVMSGRLTFFSGEQMMGEPHELPFVHDC